MSNQHNCFTCCFSLIIFEHFLFCEPILSQSDVVMSQCNLNDIDVMTDIGTIGATSFGNFATTQIIVNKELLSSSEKHYQ